METNDEIIKVAVEHEAHRMFCAELNQKLRAPLNAILGYAELLSLQPGERRGTSDLQQILKSARELLAVIEAELGEPQAPTAKSLERTSSSTEARCDLLYIEDDDVNFTLVERILEYRPKV